jgi:hypothetical protein
MTGACGQERFAFADLKFVSRTTKPGRRGDRSPDSKFRKTKCRMSILTIRHPALQSMCSKD